MRIDDEFLRLAASGKVLGARVEKTCVCSPAVKALCPHFQGGTLVLEGSDGMMTLRIGTGALSGEEVISWPLEVLAEPLPE